MDIIPHNFIGIYDDVLLEKECEIIIDHFNKEPDKCLGSDNDAKKVGATKSYNLNDPLHEYINKFTRKCVEKCFPKYKGNYPWLATGGPWWTIDEWYNIQKFGEGEGYFTPHAEAESDNSFQRMLVWMVYLNNAKSGTEFIYYNKIVTPVVGRMVIWPAGWTHTHKGVVPNEGDKYIMTGWAEYRD